MRNIILVTLVLLLSACAGNHASSTCSARSGMCSAKAGDTEIRFASGSAKLTQNSKAALQSQVTFLKSHPKNALVLEGYTDKAGSTNSNLDLGDKRARSVKAYFISQGVQPERIVTVTYGESKPKSLHNYALNRRVVITDDHN